ncbi:hypothetical protein DV515_00008319 [Chloebia gouldiae]|uniref:Protein phosphatase 1 regulatory subunit 1C n=56 Tax=Neoaves TaxID=3078114 RepID=A0A3L8SGG9_CHLGU|nr:hypothetical protein DV515_00008319 [Chloebia gouldiae]
MEPNSPKKIQFAVPLFQSQIDPEAAEQIRKRRPTPASLVIMNEHMPPVADFEHHEEGFGLTKEITAPTLRTSNGYLNVEEKDEKRTNISQAESQSASPKQRKQSVFTPPALKGTVSSTRLGGSCGRGTVGPEQSPRVMPSQHCLPTLLSLPGTAHLPDADHLSILTTESCCSGKWIKHLKSQSDSVFPEEEEGLGEREEEWGH